MEMRQAIVFSAVDEPVSIRMAEHESCAGPTAPMLGDLPRPGVEICRNTSHSYSQRKFTSLASLRPARKDQALPEPRALGPTHECRSNETNPAPAAGCSDARDPQRRLRAPPARQPPIPLVRLRSVRYQIPLLDQGFADGVCLEPTGIAEHPYSFEDNGLRNPDYLPTEQGGSDRSLRLVVPVKNLTAR